MSRLVSLLQSDSAGSGGAEMRCTSRGVLADVAHHSGQAIGVAARTIILFSDDDLEALEARQLWLVVNATRQSARTR